ncbi:PaaI family thioesterase [Pseudonocardia spirodelae]|uniref:PaaI family thioesterase n=1 Tax=Pseudonocardia spirodelae TaxID=3133431 RepID=A0ABU8T6A9_9PSEU
MNHTVPWVPVPHGGTSEDWVRWAESTGVSPQLGFECLDIGPGRARLRLTRSDWPLNPNGAVHGGLVTGWADQCFGIVAMTAVQEGQLPATATLTGEFLRAAHPPLVFDCSVDRVGRTLVFVSVEVTGRDGRTVARFRGTMAVDGSSRHLPGPLPTDGAS